MHILLWVLQVLAALMYAASGVMKVFMFDKISGECFTLSAGVDTTPLFEGLEGGQCQCPHWGFVLRGQITTTDAHGVRETVKANDLFYWPPGHNVKVDDDAEIVMFSPQREHSHVINHMLDKVDRKSVV